MPKLEVNLPLEIYEGGNFIIVGSNGYIEDSKRRGNLSGGVFEMDIPIGADAKDYLPIAKNIVRAINNHDAMMAALKRLSTAAFGRETVMGDPCSLISVKAELESARKQAVELIARIETA